MFSSNLRNLSEFQDITLTDKLLVNYLVKLNLGEVYDI